MLLDQFKKAVYGTSSYGLDILVQQDGQWEFFLVETKVQKEELRVVAYEEGRGISNLKEYKWKKDCPVYLSIRGKGILQKKAAGLKKETEEIELLRRVLPNARPEEFYWQIEEQEESTSWVAIVRKAQLDEVLQTIRSFGVHVIGVELGLIHLGKLYKALKLEKQQCLKGSLVRFGENGLEEIEAVSETTRGNVFLGNERIESYYLAALSAAFNYHGLESSGANHPGTLSEKEEHKQHRIFKIGGWGTLVFFLALLLINFLIFQHYNKKNAALSSQLGLNGALLEKLTQLQGEYERNALFFQNTGLIQNAQNAFYADRLAATKPARIYWNKLSINPPKGKFKKQEDVAFAMSKILVEGVAENTTVLNEWLFKLEEEEWVKSFDINDYQEQEKSKKGTFKLLIHLK